MMASQIAASRMSLMAWVLQVILYELLDIGAEGNMEFLGARVCRRSDVCREVQGILRG